MARSTVFSSVFAAPYGPEPVPVPVLVPVLAHVRPEMPAAVRAAGGSDTNCVCGCPEWVHVDGGVCCTFDKLRGFNGRFFCRCRKFEAVCAD